MIIVYASDPAFDDKHEKCGGSKPWRTGLSRPPDAMTVASAILGNRHSRCFTMAIQDPPARHAAPID